MNNIFFDDLRYIHDSLRGANAKLSGTTVLITGCGGFLGYYLLQYLVRYSKVNNVRKIIGVDSFILGKPAWLVKLHAEFPDILDIYAEDVSTLDINALPGVDQAEYVIHGASIASPTFYRKFPLETIQANIWGLKKLLDYYSGNKSLKGLLFFSSSEIYGDPFGEFIPTKEDYRGNVSCHGPRACYDESKRLGETLCWVYGVEHKMPVVVARPFNNYGPGMRLDDRRLPADFASAVLKGEDINILSDGKPSRTFCYVTDAIVGYLLCLFHGKYDYFNIGMDDSELSVTEMALIYKKVAKDLLHVDIQIKYTSSSDLNYLSDNPYRRCPDITKAREILLYNPQIGVELGVRRYLEFLKNESTV